MKRLLHSILGLGTGKARAKAARTSRLALEALEDRLALSTLSVRTASTSTSIWWGLGGSPASFEDSVNINVNLVGLGGSPASFGIVGAGTKHVEVPFVLQTSAGNITFNNPGLNQADTLTLSSTFAGQVNVFGSTGRSVAIGGDAGSAGTLDNIRALVVVNGPGMSLTVNDSGAQSARSYTLGGASSITGFGQVTRTDPTSHQTVTVAYKDLASVRLLAGAGNDTVNVTGSVATPATLDLGPGDDTVNVGNSLDALLGPVAIVGGGQATARGDVLTISDAGQAVGRTYTVTDNAVTKAAAGPAGVATIAYAGVEQLSLSTGNGQNTVNVLSTPAGKPITITGGHGDDVFNVGSGATAAASTLSTIRNGLTINGNGSLTGGDALNLNDAAFTSPTFWSVTDSAVGRTLSCTT
jgi:hypothetical protein